MRSLHVIARTVRPPAAALLLTSLMFSVGCSPSENPDSQTKEAWDDANNPSLFSLEIMRLEDLPRRGSIPEDKLPWSDSYWPTYAGGISQRWQEGTRGSNYRNYLYDPEESRDWLADNDRERIARLSPAEKFDLYLGRYDFPLTKFEQQRTRAAVNDDDEVPTWFGLCHGWAVASLLEKEPGPVAVVQNPQGLEIPFYTSDIGALLTHVYGFTARRGRYMGTRCNTPSHDIEYDEYGRVVQRECRDLNPGSLHLALAQMLAIPEPENRQAFTLDITSSAEVWNYPIVGYQVESLDVEDYDADDDELARFRADGTAQLAHVEVRVFHVGGAQPHTRPLADRSRYIKAETYEYTLELDEDGRIIGGEWTSENRPDFMWMITQKPSGTELLPHAEVAKLLDLSRGEMSP